MTGKPTLSVGERSEYVINANISREISGESVRRKFFFLFFFWASSSSDLGVIPGGTGEEMRVAA